MAAVGGGHFASRRALLSPPVVSTSYHIYPAHPRAKKRILYFVTHFIFHDLAHFTTSCAIDTERLWWYTSDAL
jgi:hypothetical protein